MRQRLLTCAHASGQIALHYLPAATKASPPATPRHIAERTILCALVSKQETKIVLIQGMERKEVLDVTKSGSFPILYIPTVSTVTPRRTGLRLSFDPLPPIDCSPRLGSAPISAVLACRGDRGRCQPAVQD
jgi:hypothetical protein